MKSFIFGVLLLGFAPWGSASDLGQRVNIYADADGPQFSVVFANDEDKVWVAAISLWGGDFLPDFSMKTLAWRLLDSRSGQYINSWTTAVNNPSRTIYPGTMSFSWGLTPETEVLAGIKALPNMKLLLSVDGDLSNPRATHFIDLGAYCRSNPGHFMNVTTGGSGCASN